MRNNIRNLLADHAKWIFSGIGVIFISFIMNNTCSNGAEDNINSGKIGRDEVGTINYGDKVGGDKISVLRNNIKIERIIDNQGQYAEGDIHNEAPSFRDVTVARGDNGNPVGVADNPSPIQGALASLGKLMRGEEVTPQEASPSKFLINSETAIALLEPDNSSEQSSTGLTDPIGFTQFVKIKILEGPHKGKTGWIHASVIHHEQRKK